MKKQSGNSNLGRVFGVEDPPPDTQIREFLDGTPTEPLRRILPEVFERMGRVGGGSEVCDRSRWGEVFHGGFGSEYGESLRGLWTMLRSAFYLVAVDSWSELLLNHLSDEACSP